MGTICLYPQDWQTRSYEYDKDYPFAAFITNLGKYNEGSLVGEWVKFPTTAEELQKVFERIGIGSKDDFGQPYEEWFITDYDCYVDGLYDKLGEYENLDELNYLASKLDEMSQGEYEQFQAAMEIGDHSGSLQEIINLTENLDCYDVYLPSEIEKFKDATGYEEFLDFDPAVIKAALEDPDKSHVDEMLAFAEQAGRDYEAELAGQATAPSPDDRETGETVRTPRGTFYVTDMSREQMEAAGYGFHHQSDDGKYLIMGNSSRSFAIRNEEAQEHAAPEKMMVLVVEPMKEPYLKEIDLGLHSLQAEVGGDIAASDPFSDPVGLVCNDEGKLIGLELNRGLRDEDGNLYDIMAGTFLVVGLGEEDFTSLPPELAQKYMEHFKQPEQFINLNGQIIALPVEPENPLRTAEMTVEDDYGMIDGVINNGRKGEELEAAKGEVRRTSPEKKPSIRERLEAAKKECGERKPPDKAHQKKPPEHDL